MKKFEGKEHELIERLQTRYDPSKKKTPKTKVIASATLTENNTEGGGDQEQGKTGGKTHVRTQSMLAAEKAKAILDHAKDAKEKKEKKEIEEIKKKVDGRR